jgi:hypothetical protein
MKKVLQARVSNEKGLFFAMSYPLARYLKGAESDMLVTGLFNSETA